MSKRELSRDTTMLPELSPEVDVTMSEPEPEFHRPNGSSSHAGGQSLKTQGLQLLQTVKEAKAKDGRQLALAFLTKPPRKIYPDYYQLIHKPIALDDIKKRIDTNAYPSLNALRADFELLFNNALQYNMKESVIWKDAKDMLKLMQKTYEKLAPSEGVEEGSDEDEKKGKSKGPSLYRMIKSRLQKLIEKTDKDGRVMSTEFMELPNKKVWTIYYKQIKQPRCFEGIFRKIKRKEYHTSAAFAADVELVFSNAMAFNQDHTVIWEDALALREYFRQLMSDLPPPFSLPEYSNNKVVTNKIRIKPPAAPPAAQYDSATSKPEPSSSSLLLRVPAASTAAAKSSQSTAPTQAKAKPSSASATPATPSAAASTAIISATMVSGKAPVAPHPQRPAQQSIAPAIQATKSTSATPQPAATAQQASLTYSHYYQPIPPPAPATSTPASSAVKTVPTASNSPAPAPIHPSHEIKYVRVQIQPQGRLFWLDHREGVKTWAMRLAPGETGLYIDDLVFAGDEDGEESSDDEEEEEEEEDDMEIDGSTSSPKNGRTRKGKTAVRRSQRAAAVTTRTTRSAVAKNKVQEKKKEVEKVEEVLLKLNGIVVKEKEDTSRQWNVSLPVGPNMLEVGEKGGLMWKVYVERIADW